MIVLWGAATAVFLAVELATVGLTSIWFALGSAAALVLALLHAALWLQIACFVAVSAAALALTRPLAQKFINSRTQPTNAVAVDGKVWTARSADGGVIAPGAVVTVEHIDGVKLIVAPLRNSEKTAEEETEHA